MPPTKNPTIESHCDVRYQNIVKGCYVSLLKRLLLCNSLQSISVIYFFNVLNFVIFLLFQIVSMHVIICYTTYFNFTSIPELPVYINNVLRAPFYFPVLENFICDTCTSLLPTPSVSSHRFSNS